MVDPMAFLTTNTRRLMQDRTVLRFRRRPFRTCIASCALIFAAGCQGSAPTSDAAAEADAAPPPQVAVVEAQRVVWPQTIRVQGSLLGDETAVIGAKIAGRVEHVPVDLGSIVRRGQTLVVLDLSELQLRVQQAEAQLRQACAAIGSTPERPESELRREMAPPVVLERALVDEARAALARAERLSRQSVSETELERLTAQLKTAEARYQSALNNVGEQIALIGLRRTELALAQQQLNDATIVAPFDGVIERRQVSPGEYVQVGQAVATLVRTDTLRFTAGVPESKAATVRPGQKVLIRVSSDSPPEEALISRVSPMVSQSSRALWIEADVHNPEMRWQAGVFARAEIVVDPAATTLVAPEAAITEFAGIQKIWTVRDGEAVEQAVRTGRREDGRVEILEGLATGDLIVSDYQHGHAGSVVAVREPSAPTHQATLPTASAE